LLEIGHENANFCHSNHHRFGIGYGRMQAGSEGAGTRPARAINRPATGRISEHGGDWNRTKFCHRRSSGAGEGPLPAVKVDRGHALASFQQRYGNMKSNGRLARPALFVTQHNDVCRAGLPMRRLQQHCTFLFDYRQSGKIEQQDLI